MSEFIKTFHARWGDMDFNGHMRNTAYLDTAGDVRMLFFAENGFPIAEFTRLGVGPVIMSDTLEYFRELRLLDPLHVSLVVLAMSEDGSRFKLKNEFKRADGKKAAVVTSMGGWMNLAERKLIPAPPQLFEAMKRAPKEGELEVLPSLPR